MKFSDAETLIRSVVKEHTADHLCRSWRGRKKNFGDFFLNLSHDAQGDFISRFGISVPGLEEYKEAQKVISVETIFMDGPYTVMWLHELMKFFYNNSVSSSSNGLTLPEKPYKGDRYGDSTNWGKYILSLSYEDQLNVLGQIEEIVMSQKTTARRTV